MRCGKSTLLEMYIRADGGKEQIQHGEHHHCGIVSHVIEMYHPTLLIDEADSFLKGAKTAGTNVELSQAS